MKKEAGIKQRTKTLLAAVRWSFETSRPLCMLVLAVGILGGVLTLVEPYIFKIILDTLTATKDLSTPEKVGLSIGSLLLIYAVARILQSIFWDINNNLRRAYSLRIEKHITQKMMANISSLDLAYFEDPEYYNTLNRATSNLWRMNEFFWEFTFFILELVSSLVIIGALATHDIRILLLVSLGAIPSIIVAIRSGANFWSNYEESSPMYRQTSYYKNLLTERPEAIKEIRSFGLREHFLSRFTQLFTRYIHVQDKVVRKELRQFISVTIIEGTLSVIAAWLAIQAFIKKEITIGELTFIWTLLFQFAGHVRWLVRMIGNFNTHALFLGPLVKVMHFKPKIISPSNPRKFPERIQQGIAFQNVSFKYPHANKYALKNISLTIKPSESIALVGENGSGKTSFIKLLARLYDPTEGAILIDGINSKEYAVEDIQKNTGIIFQDFMKYEAAVKDNIRYGRLEEKSHKEKVHTAALKAEAWYFIKDLEKTYQTHLGKTLKNEGTELSLGQWQKIALARAFFRNAQVLILDEPTSAVDANAEYKLFQRFKELTKNKITFLISHRFSTVRMASKIIVMNKGKIVEIGSHQELLKKKGMYAKMFRLQAKGYQ